VELVAPLVIEDEGSTVVSSFEDVVGSTSVEECEELVSTDDDSSGCDVVEEDDCAALIDVEIVVDDDDCDVGDDDVETVAAPATPFLSRRMAATLNVPIP